MQDAGPFRDGNRLVPPRVGKYEVIPWFLRAHWKNQSIFLSKAKKACQNKPKPLDKDLTGL